MAEGDGLSLRQALALAAEHSPELKPILLELPALDGRREQAGLRPNPSLTLDLENVAGTGAAAGARGMELTLALSQTLELGDKRRLRVAIVDAEYGLAESEIAVRRLDIATEVLRRFVRVAQTQEALLLSERGVELAERIYSVVEARVRAARTPAAELHRATAARDQALLDQEGTHTELDVARHRLAALWGAETPDFDAVEADFYRLPAVAELDTLIEQLQYSPDIAALISEERLRDAELRMAQARRRQDLSLSGGLRRLEASDDMALIFSVAVPLGVFDRNQGAIREAQVRREQTGVRREALLARARAELYEAYQGLLRNRRVVETIRSRLLPELETALSQIETAYRLGRYSYLELADAQRALLETQARLIAAAASHHEILAEMERLTGQTFALPDQLPEN